MRPTKFTAWARGIKIGYPAYSNIVYASIVISEAEVDHFLCGLFTIKTAFLALIKPIFSFFFLFLKSGAKSFLNAAPEGHMELPSIT